MIYPLVIFVFLLHPHFAHQPDLGPSASHLPGEFLQPGLIGDLELRAADVNQPFVGETVQETANHLPGGADARGHIV
jgi:hypothetical protein